MAYKEKIVKYRKANYPPISDEQIQGMAIDLLDWVQGLIDKHGHEVMIDVEWFDYGEAIELYGQHKIVETDAAYAKRIAKEVEGSRLFEEKLAEDHRLCEAKAAKAIAGNDGGPTSL